MNDRSRLDELLAAAARQQKRWRWSDAHDLLQHAVAMARALGVRDTELTMLDCRRMLAETLRELGLVDQAREIALPLLADCRTYAGPAHPVTLRTAAVAGAILHDQGDLDAAEQLYLRLVDTRQPGDGPAARAVMLARVNLALLHRDRGNLTGALAVLTGVYAAFRRQYGTEDLDTIRIAVELADLHRQCGDINNARRLLTVAHAAARHAFGDDHRLTDVVEAELEAIEPAFPSPPIEMPATAMPGTAMPGTAMPGTAMPGPAMSMPGPAMPSPAMPSPAMPGPVPAGGPRAGVPPTVTPPPAVPPAAAPHASSPPRVEQPQPPQPVQPRAPQPVQPPQVRQVRPDAQSPRHRFSVPPHPPVSYPYHQPAPNGADPRPGSGPPAGAGPPPAARPAPRPAPPRPAARSVSPRPAPAQPAPRSAPPRGQPVPDADAVAALHAMPPLYVPPERGSPADRAVAAGRADPVDHGTAQRVTRLGRTRGSGGGGAHAAHRAPGKALIRRTPVKPPVSLRHRAAPAEQPSRRVRAVALAGLAVIIIAGTAIVAVGLTRRHGTGSQPSDLSVANVIGATLAPAPAADADPTGRRAPRNVRLRDNGTTITVSWADPADGPAPIVVAVAPAEEPPQVDAALEPGTRQYELRGLDPKREYCVVVASFHEADSFAQSTAVCTRRRSAAPASGSR